MTLIVGRTCLGEFSWNVSVRACVCLWRCSGGVLLGFLPTANDHGTPQTFLILRNQGLAVRLHLLQTERGREVQGVRYRVVRSTKETLPEKQLCRYVQ